MPETRYCVRCGEAFEPAGPQALCCPACGGPPAGLVTRAEAAGSQAVAAPAHGLVTRAEAASRVAVATPPAALVTRLDEAAAAFDLDEWRPSQVVFDLYQVRGVLGQGGMGRVYRVYHPGWDLDLAVKCPLPGAFRTAEQQDAFISEADTWVRLGLHPHIVTCHYVRSLRGVPRVFAECVEGGSLRQWIQGRRLASPAQRLDVAIQFAWGLAYAHERGLAHRDVKPDNVLLTPAGTAKVTDFGLARAVRGLTPAYCSPEQAESETQAQAGVPAAQRVALTPATDVWSWGLSVLEVFAGWPFWVRAGAGDYAWGQLAPDALDDYLAGDVEGAAAAGMPPALAKILRECFQRDPAARPASLRAVAEDLQSAYQAETGEPYPRPSVASVDLRADSLNNRAVSLLDLGQAAGAEAAWREALSADPHQAEAVFNLELWQWRAGQQPSDLELIKRLDEQAQLDAGQGWVHYLLSQLHAERGDRAAALSALAAAEQQRPGRPEYAPAHARIESLAEAGCLRAFESPGGAVHDLAAAPRGGLVAGAHEDGQVRLWDPATGQCRQVLSGHTAAVYGVAFSPDGTRLASTGLDHDLRVWDLRSGDCLLTLPVKSVHYTVAWSPNGRWLVSGGHDHILQVREAATGRLVRLLRGHDQDVAAAVFTPDSRGIVSASQDKTLKVWDIAGECRRTLEGHTGTIYALALSADGRRALSGSGMPLRFTGDETARLWSLDSGKCLHVFSGHLQNVRAVALSPDAQWVVTGSNDRTLRLWQAATGRCCRTFDVPGLGVSALVWLPEARLLVGTFDGRLQLWGLRDVERLHAAWAVNRPQELGQRLEADRAYQQARAAAQAALDAGRYAEALAALRAMRATADYERDHELLDLRHAAGLRGGRRTGVFGAYQRHLLRGHTEGVMALALASDGRRAVSAGGGFGSGRPRQVCVWDVLAGTCLRTLESEKDGQAVAITPDGRRALVGGDHEVRELDLDSGEWLRVLDEHASPVRALAVSPDGQSLLSGSSLMFTSGVGMLLLWDLAAGTVLRRLEGHALTVTCAAFTVDGRGVLSGSQDKTLRLWDAGSGQCLRVFEGHRDAVTALAASPNGATVVTASDDATLRVWDLASGDCQRTLKGHMLAVKAVALAPDGRFAVSGSADHSLRVWSLESGKCLSTLAGHRLDVTGLAVTPDGRYVISASLDETVRCWELDWDFECPAAADWDAAAGPYLRLFLARHGRGWGEAELARLLSELQQRGLGWLRPEALRRRLRQRLAA